METRRVGERIGGVLIEGQIARGGMGIVYRARDEELGRPVALKVIDPALADDPGFRARFEREARIAASVDHPHAVPIYRAGQDGDSLFIAMRLIEGRDLARIIADDQWLAPSRAVELVTQVADALDAIHAKGLIHRDLKPANILVSRVGDREWAYLTDFGVARSAAEDPGLTGTGQRLGTADYTSPEQVVGGVVDSRSDVYALGGVLYTALTGSVPFPRDDDVAKLYAHVHDPPPKARSLSPAVLPALDAVIEIAMEKDPARRYGSAGELAAAARDAAASSSAADSLEVAGPTNRLHGDGEARHRPNGRRLAFGAGLAVAAVAVVLAVIALTGEDGPRPESLTAVGSDPVGVVVTQGVVWVANRGEGTLSRIDSSTGETAGQPVPVGESPSGVAAGDRLLWVADAGAGELRRIETPAGRPVPDPTPIAPRTSGLAIGEGAVWAASVTADLVAKVDPGSAQVLRRIPVGDSPSGVAAGEGAVWVANSSDGTVTRIAPGQGEVVGDAIPVGGRPRGVAAGEGAVWVANSLDGTVSRIDPASAEATDTIRVGARPAQVAVGEGAVWVANERDGTVSRIDPGSLDVTDTIQVGDAPRGIAVGDGSVWVANSGDETLTRIEP